MMRVTEFAEWYRIRRAIKEIGKMPRKPKSKDVTPAVAKSDEQAVQDAQTVQEEQNLQTVQEEQNVQTVAADSDVSVVEQQADTTVDVPNKITENSAQTKQAETSQSEDPVEVFVTDCEKGLSSEEVDERVAQGKVNGDQNVKTKSVGQIFRENIVTFFNFVFLAFAVLIVFFVNGNDNILTICGNFGFMILIIFNALVGIFQELRAKRTIDKLSLLSAPKAVVLRDGEQKEIAISDIVLDDITILSSGSQICADAVVAEGSIEVNESLITGEPDSILKNVGDEIMSGSFVVSGNAKAQVKHVGMDNFVAKISAGAKYFKKPNSEIWRSLMLIVKIMASIIVPMGILLFCVKYFVQKDAEGTREMITTLFGYKISTHLSDTVLGTIATLIGMIPSGLVALSSTVFCVSIIRLSRHKTLAQDLYCVETLARVDVLCLDKTGTITEGTMDVNGIEPSKGKDEEQIKQIIKNVTSALDDDNATINALRAFVNDLQTCGEVEQTVPFSSQRKWSGARIDGVSYVMGAPEFVFARKTKTLEHTTNEMAQKGYRVMVVASSKNAFSGNALPKSLKLESFIYITDTIRAEAPDTLRFFKQEGVTVKVISGDNPQTVRAVAMRAGLEDCDNIIDMSTLTTEEEVYEAATKYTIFGRVLPDQKLMLVKALKKAGHTVAMTGDGVNDVLALKEADCSVAMASGSDAAKNVSSLVLLDSNFASMPRVVAEGRRSINNLERSAALYIMKTVYNTLLALLFMLVVEPLPFTPQNLTIMGAVTIGIPSVVLALEPNADRVTGRFLPKVLSNAVPGGVTVMLGAIAVVLCNRFFLTHLSPEQSQTIFIWVITFVGFLLLFKVSLPTRLASWSAFFGISDLMKEREKAKTQGEQPVKKRRKFKVDKSKLLVSLNLTTYLLMLFIFFGVYFMHTDANINGKTVDLVQILRDFFNLDNHVTWEMGKAMLAICAVLIVLYVGFVAMMNQVKLEHGESIERRFERLDIKLREKSQAPPKEKKPKKEKIKNKNK